jgi:hypothetical protein
MYRVFPTVFDEDNEVEFLFLLLLLVVVVSLVGTGLEDVVGAIAGDDCVDDWAPPLAAVPAPVTTSSKSIVILLNPLMIVPSLLLIGDGDAAGMIEAHSCNI